MQIDPKTKGVVKIGSVNLPVDSLLNSPVLSFQKNGKEILVGFFGIRSFHETEVDKGKMILVMKFKDQKSKTFKPNTNTKLIKLGDNLSIVFESTIGEKDFKYFANNKVSELQFKFKEHRNAIYNVIIDDNLARMIVQSLECLKN